MFQHLFLLAALLVFGSAAWAAQVAGRVAHLSGPLMAKKLDGSIKVLALRSEVESGDTLVTEKNTYAQIKFIDNSEITLRPGTTFKVEQFAFDDGKPEGDVASFSLVKGGLRSITGLMGKRNKEKFSLKTPGATIGIRGTTFIAQWVPPPPAPGQAGGKLPRGPDGPLGVSAALASKTPAAPAVPGAPGLAPGLYVHVIDGLINLTNPGGQQSFSAGQFGYVPSQTLPPVIVPNNPGLQFTPPPAFNLPSAGPGSTGSIPRDANTVDCEVR